MSTFKLKVHAPKSVYGRGSAPNRAEPAEAYDAPPEPLVGWGGDTPFPFRLPRRRF